MRARLRDAGWILLVCVTAVASTRWAGAWGSPAEASFVGALSVGVVGHLFARFRDRPATLLLTPGTFLLVPGSVGFLSVSSLLSNDVNRAVELAFKTGTVAMALTAGLLVAAFAVPPRRAL